MARAPQAEAVVKLTYELMPHWPPLAWIARCDRGVASIHVTHGSGVETRGDWFCEAVWPGDFDAGDFDRTDLVFGSGGRRRLRELRFVSSAATVDRLQLLDREDGIFVSNSLPCLLEAVGGDIDPVYPGYYRDFRTIVRGIRDHEPLLETTAGPVRLVYYFNIIWDGQAWELVEKSGPERRFPGYEAYLDFIRGALQAIGKNLCSPSRTYGYQPIGTLSRGYDSPAVAALAREAGLEEVITFRDARGGADDSGNGIASRLGLAVTESPRAAWRALPGSIIPHAASNAYGEEVPYAAVASMLAGRVLFTGHTGDRAWGKGAGLDPSPDIPRGDPVGLSLTEARLWYGTLHCPVPFMGIRQIRDLHRISRSGEMAPWDVPGEYSRPIPRRIAEDAGVPRHLFGQKKMASAVVLWKRKEFLLPKADHESLRRWLFRNRHHWDERGLRSPLRQSRKERVTSGVMALYRPVHALASLIAPLKPYSDRISRLDPRGRTHPLFEVLFPWALEEARKRYRSRPHAAPTSRGWSPSRRRL